MTGLCPCFYSLNDSENTLNYTVLCSSIVCVCVNDGLRDYKQLYVK